MATPYWTWSNEHNQYHHVERNRNTGQWEHSWAKNPTPRTTIISHPDPLPQPQPPAPHPLEPYGSKRFAVPTQSLAGGAASVTQGLAHINISGGQRSLQSGQPVIVPATPGASSQRGAANYLTYNSSLSIEPSNSVRQADRHYTHRGPQIQYNQPLTEGYGVRDRRASLNARSSAVSPYQTSQPTTYESRHAPVQLTQAQKTGPINYASRSQTIGSSQEAQASSASHSIPALISSTEFRDHFVDPRNEKLNPREYNQILNSRKFFIPGKVFSMFYIENAGQTSDHASLGGTNFTTVAHGEIAHHQFRRFVVVEVASKENFCYCCPITTYGGRATTKPGVDQSAHTIVYSTNDPPQKLPGETKMNKDPLFIVLHSLDEKLDSRSRINLGRAYLIEHNVKIKKIGDVHPKSLPKLMAYRREIRNKMP